MKKFLLILSAFAYLQAKAQKSRTDSLQTMPGLLFAKGNILNCSLLGYRKSYMFRFLFSGGKKPVTATLSHEVADDEYFGNIERKAFNSDWYRSPGVASYLQNWVFDIAPSPDVFRFGAWVKGVNPTGATDQFYVHLPGGKFMIVKGLDTLNYRHWKLFMEQTPMQYDSVQVEQDEIAVNYGHSGEQDVFDPKYLVKVKVYSFLNSTEQIAIAQWGDLFFPFSYTYRKKGLPQYRLSSIQVGF